MPLHKPITWPGRGRDQAQEHTSAGEGRGQEGEQECAKNALDSLSWFTDVMS